MVRTPRRRGETGGNDQSAREESCPRSGLSNRQSEIPCRVSSDLHEWRNDLGAVSARGPAKLHWR